MPTCEQVSTLYHIKARVAGGSAIAYSRSPNSTRLASDPNAHSFAFGIRAGPVVFCGLARLVSVPAHFGMHAAPNMLP